MSNLFGFPSPVFGGNSNLITSFLSFSPRNVQIAYVHITDLLFPLQFLFACYYNYIFI